MNPRALVSIEAGWRQSCERAPHGETPNETLPAFAQAQPLQPLRVVVANAGASPGRQHAYERPSALTQLAGVPAPPPPARRNPEAAARVQPVSPTGMAPPAHRVRANACALMTALCHALPSLSACLLAHHVR